MFRPNAPPGSCDNGGPYGQAGFRSPMSRPRFQSSPRYQQNFSQSPRGFSPHQGSPYSRGAHNRSPHADNRPFRPHYSPKNNTTDPSLGFHQQGSPFGQPFGDRSFNSSSGSFDGSHGNNSFSSHRGNSPMGDHSFGRGRGRGYNKMSRGSDCNPGGSGDISQYYSPEIVKDPWANLMPQDSHNSGR